MTIENAWEAFYALLPSRPRVEWSRDELDEVRRVFADLAAKIVAADRRRRAES